ncbi:MAG: hypothetical protein WCE23_16535 [Candidatus Binatus sp.]|uniref:hypothetical protein n=1 Tax=Candidatus Binatus sp. TaxID=2811406 RepID=UPI003C71E99D
MEAIKNPRGRGAGVNLAGAPSAARERMWKAMRILRRFQIGELLQVAEIARRKAAERYLRDLTGADYLRIEKRVRGCEGSVYVLIRNTGPFAPRVGRKGLTIDPNIEIIRLRELRENLTAQITACDKRLIRLGAFVERQKLGGQN